MADQARFTPDEIRLHLTGENPGFAAQRKLFMRLPTDPRCKLCAVPFRGVGAMALRPFGFARSANPSLCTKCVVELRKWGLTGVEIPVSLVFSDVRGSTSLGERMSPTEFHAFLEHFYRLATDAITRHNGVVDKIVGDEVIGLFFGGVSGPDHPGAAVAAALELAEAAAGPDSTPAGPIPVGTAVHTGEAFVGATGPADAVDDFTALGDTVNTTARLASVAAAGEVLASRAVADATDVGEALGSRSVDLRGRIEPIEVLVLRAAAQEPAGS